VIKYVIIINVILMDRYEVVIGIAKVRW